MPAFENGDGPIARLSVVLAQLEASLKNASLPNETSALLKEAREIVDGQDEYLENISTPSADILGPMIQASDQEDWDAVYERGDTKFRLLRQMCAGQYEASVMQQFARMSKAKAILEIGMFTGTTTLALASLEQVESVIPLDIEPFLVSWAEPWWKKARVAQKIHPRIGDGQEILRQLGKEQKTFDMIFIDANKDGYAAYYDLIMDHHLLSPKGVIIADNTAYRGHPWAATEKWGGELGQAIADFNKKIRADDRVKVVLLPIRDGMSLIQLQ